MAVKNCDTMIVNDMRPFLVRYKDGRVVRLFNSPFVPSSQAAGEAGLATRDVIIDPTTGVSVRLFRTVGVVTRGSSKNKLPLVIYYHGGAFCSGSAFSKVFHRYASSLCADAGAVVVSVEYRLAPEHPIPAVYDDGWVALKWAASLADPWLAEYADPERMFLVGESAGGNIIHNMAARAATARDCQDTINIEGIVLLQPFFWGTERLPSEMDRDDEPLFVPHRVDPLWSFLTAGTAGSDDPRLNPLVEQVMSLPCRRALVALASKDLLRDRGFQYATWLRLGKKCHEVTLIESKGEDHGFHLNPRAGASALKLMDHVVNFINKTEPPPITAHVKHRRTLPRSRL